MEKFSQNPQDLTNIELIDRIEILMDLVFAITKDAATTSEVSVFVDSLEKLELLNESTTGFILEAKRRKLQPSDRLFENRQIKQLPELQKIVQARMDKIKIGLTALGY